MTGGRTGREALAFFIAAAATRNELRTTRSRLQVVAFGGVAVLYECILAGSGGRRSIRAVAINAAAAAAAIGLIKLAIEGVPDRIATGRSFEV